MLNILSIILLLIAVSPVYAHLHGNEDQDKLFNFESPGDTEPFQAVEHGEEYYGCSGYVRVGYIQTNHTSASAMGGELGCGYQLNPYIKAHLGVFASFDPGLNSHNDDNIQGEFFNQKKDSYLIVGEAVLTLSYQQFEAHLGRQNFDSPHMDADDLRLIANLFEAYLLDYHFSDELYFGAGYIREVSGWENGSNASQFVSIAKALGGESNGAWLSWVSYQQDKVTSDIWFYIIPDHLSILYSEFIFSSELTETISYNLGVQYDWGGSTGQEKLGHIDTHVFGVLSAITWRDITLTAAYNKNLGATGALPSIGGGPFFTSVEDQTLDAVTGNDSQSAMLSLEYNLNDYLTLGVAAATYTAANENDYNKEEINLFANYSWKNSITAELIYAAVDDRNSGPDFHQLRAILTYRY